MDYTEIEVGIHLLGIEFQYALEIHLCFVVLPQLASQRPYIQQRLHIISIYLKGPFEFLQGKFVDALPLMGKSLKIDSVRVFGILPKHVPRLFQCPHNVTANHTCLGKGQTVRLIDVWALGPLMTWGGLQVAANARTDTEALAGNLLALSGVATVIFNGVNYLRLRDSAGRGY